MKNTVDTHVRPARPDELPSLTELCLRSKAVWGYDAAFLEACRAELTLGANDLTATHIAVAESADTVVGVVQVEIAGRTADLLKLFIEPEDFGNGTGRRLFDWACDVARDLGATNLTIEADPDAAPFYRRMGARDDGFAPSGSIPGRMLPRLVLDLSADLPRTA